MLLSGRQLLFVVHCTELLFPLQQLSIRVLVRSARLGLQASVALKLQLVLRSVLLSRVSWVLLRRLLRCQCLGA
jgi:hypothetical protein